MNLEADLKIHVVQLSRSRFIMSSKQNIDTRVKSASVKRGSWITESGISHFH